MIRSIVFPRVLGKSLEDLKPALELFRALGFAPGNEWHEGGSHGVEMLAPSGGIEFIAASGAPPVDATVEVVDADAAYEIVEKLVPTLSPKIGDKDGAPVYASGRFGGRFTIRLPARGSSKSKSVDYGSDSLPMRRSPAKPVGWKASWMAGARASLWSSAASIPSSPSACWTARFRHSDNVGQAHQI